MKITIREQGIIYEGLKLWQNKYVKDKYPQKFKGLAIRKYLNWYTKELKNKDNDLYWYEKIIENINKLFYKE